MTDPLWLTAAIQAGAHALYRASGDAATDCDEWDTCGRDAREVIRAALPAIREGLAKAIEEAIPRRSSLMMSYRGGLIDGAFIVRGGDR